MANDPTQYLDALSAPLGDLIASVGRGVAEAQRALDTSTLETIREIYEENQDDDGFLLTLRGLGYQPTWYSIPEATGEITVAVTVGGHVGPASDPVLRLAAPAQHQPLRLYASPVDAGYQNRFQFDVRAASKLTFRIVPVPPSTLAEQIRVVPNLVGLTAAEVDTRLAGLGILATLAAGQSEPAPQATVASQQPAAGELITPGRTVELTFEPLPPAPPEEAGARRESRAAPRRVAGVARPGRVDLWLVTADSCSGA